MDRLWVRPEFARDFQAAGLESARQVLAHVDHAKRIPEASETVVTSLRFTVGELDVPAFFKLYPFSRPSWGFLGRASKARREVLSYHEFEKLGIPCARWIACGEVRDRIGRLRSAFIITEALRGAVPLGEFIVLECADAADPASRLVRDAVSMQLARYARLIHDAGFYHNDLHWRNVLVSMGENGPVVWWIDCPRGGFDRFSPLRRRRAVKDLACLNRTAANHCTRTERLRFMRRYLDGEYERSGRTLVSDVLAYTRQKWGGHPSRNTSPQR